MNKTGMARWEHEGLWFGVAWSPAGIVALDFWRKRESDVLKGACPAGYPTVAINEAPKFIKAFRVKLDNYLSGKMVNFDEPLDLSVGTPFQQSVWRAAREVPYGESVSYGELAARIGKPRAARAVGSALGANPVPILVPCHRVLAAGGRVGGFSRGLDAKLRLLATEG